MMIETRHESAIIDETPSTAAAFTRHLPTPSAAPIRASDRRGRQERRRPFPDDGQLPRHPATDRPPTTAVCNVFSTCAVVAVRRREKVVVVCRPVVGNVAVEAQSSAGGGVAHPSRATAHRSPTAAKEDFRSVQGVSVAGECPKNPFQSKMYNGGMRKGGKRADETAAGRERGDTPASASTIKQPSPSATNC